MATMVLFSRLPFDAYFRHVFAEDDSDNVLCRKVGLASYIEFYDDGYAGDEKLFSARSDFYVIPETIKHG